MAERAIGAARRRRGPSAVIGRGLRAGLLLTALALAGCGANMRAALSTAGQAIDGGASTLDAGAPLDPRFEYLRVQIGRQAGRMVRGDPDGQAGGRVSTWYSADGAVLRLDEGRLLGFSDGQRSWQARAVPTPAPSPESWDWMAIAAGRPLRYERIVDRQPGYRIGQPELRVVELAAGPPPGHRYPGGEGPVRWFVDRDIDGRGLPTWYAVAADRAPGEAVRYGQTCPWAETCLSWQPWPPKTRP